MKALPALLLLVILVSGCGRMDTEGWESFVRDLERRGLEGTVTVTPPDSSELLATNITYVIDAGNQQKQAITILEFPYLDAAVDYYDVLKRGEATNFAARNGEFVMSCDFQPLDTNQAVRVREIFMHYRRSRIAKPK